MKNKKTHKIGQRSLTGAALVAVITAAVYLSPLTCLLLLMLLMLLCLFEFSVLLKKLNITIPLTYLMGLAEVSLFAAFIGQWYKLEWTIWLFPALLLLIMPLTFLFRPKQKLINIAYSYFALLYIVTPFIALAILAFNIEKTYTWRFLLPLFVMIWLNDSFAYLAGISFGRHKLCPKLSPKKTWEGAIGGIAATLLSVVVFCRFADFECYHWLISAFLVSVFAIAGDLFESMIKRQAKVKDSGQFLAGHGGFLDRFDSLLFAAPIFSLYWLTVNNF